MINPESPFLYNADKARLEEFLIFCICVANKNASRTAMVVDKLLSYEKRGTPLEKIKNMVKRRKLGVILREIRTGQYKRIEGAFNYLAANNIDLENCSIDELLAVPGIGQKTARYFILCTRRKQNIAALDTHILKFLNDRGYNVPKSTPQSNTAYERVEKLFLKEAVDSGLAPADFDLTIWRIYSKGGGLEELGKEIGRGYGTETPR